MLDVAFKEWAIVCELLAEGRLALLLRKGGIAEAGGAGVFELEHKRFALAPSWAHQQPHLIQAAYRSRVRVLDEPTELSFSAIAEVAGVWRAPQREAIDGLEDLHCWTPPYVDMRFAYKPRRPLYVMALRVSRLHSPKTVAYDAPYVGCRSWIALKPGDEVDDDGATPVLDDTAFAAVLARVSEALT